MQNRYVGDVGDFGKLGLLRWLSGETAGDGERRLRLGLVWYLRYDEQHDGDRKKISNAGKHTKYLDVTTDNVRGYAACDPELWAKLGLLVAQNRRCVHCVQIIRPLPENTLYYGARLDFIPHCPPDLKRQIREHWLRQALRAMKNAEIVCLDPDNGIAPEDKMLHEDGPKYTYLTDLQRFWAAGKTLVIYQQVGMDKPAPTRVAETIALLAEAIPEATPIPMRFHKGSSRIFFIVPQEGERELIEARLASMEQSLWFRNELFSRE